MVLPIVVWVLVPAVFRDLLDIERNERERRGWAAPTLPQLRSDAPPDRYWGSEQRGAKVAGDWLNQKVAWCFVRVCVDHRGGKGERAKLFIQLPRGAEGKSPCKTKEISAVVLIWVSETLMRPAGIRSGRETTTEVVCNIIVVDDRDGELCLDMVHGRCELRMSDGQWEMADH